jgi:site-specific DNA-methyltransferase (adenine-specific)
MSAYQIVHGEVVEVLREYKDNSFDALCCDPPYGFKFLNKTWDYDVPSKELWAECLRVLKPGAPLVAFGGSRTYHRLACAVEDAGFELRDQLCWLYAKGFPKSQNISLALDKAAGAERRVVGTRTLTGNAAVSLKDKGGTYGVQVGVVPPKVVDVTVPATELAQLWDGYGSALKPSHEPIVLARKPLEGTMVANVTRWGVGGLAIDACRIGSEPAGWGGGGRGAGIWDEESCGMKAGAARPVDGRWPANLLFSHTERCQQLGTESGHGYARNRQTDGAHPFGDAAGSEFTSEPVSETVEIWQCAEDCPIRIFDAEVGPRASGVAVHRNGGGENLFSGLKSNTSYVLPRMVAKPDVGYLDGKTNPSRFFFSSKVSTKEREAGCEHLPKKSSQEINGREEDSAGQNNPRAGASAGRTGGAHNHHPTLKPIGLTTWLARLIAPPRPGAILVPFAGSGSEMIGCLKAGWGAVLGIERESEYVEIARARLKYWCPESEG